MGILLLAGAIALTIWAWVTWGWLGGLIVGVLSFMAVGFMRSRNAQRNLEFHEAWDSLIGPPTTPDELSSKRNWHRPQWKSENRRTGITAYDYLLKQNEWNEAWNSLIGSPATAGELSTFESSDWRAENATTGISARDYILRGRPLNPEGPDIAGLSPDEALQEAIRWNAVYGEADKADGAP